MFWQSCLISLALFLGCRVTEVMAADGSPYSIELETIEQQLLVNPRLALEQVDAIFGGIESHGRVAAIVHARYIAARAYSLLGQGDEVLARAEPALKYRYEDIELRTLIKLLCAAAEGYEFTGAKDQAEYFFHDAIKRADASGDPWLKAYARNALAWSENREVHEKEAIKLLKEAFQLIQDRPKDDLYADLLNNLGTLYSIRETERTRESEKLLLESLAYFENKGRTFYVATILYNLGLLYRTSDPERSAQVLNRALRSSELIQDAAGVAYAHYALGMTYRDLKQPRKGVEEMELALKGFEATQNRMMLAETWAHYLRCLLDAGLVEKARHVLPEAERVIRKDANSKSMLSLFRIKILIYQTFHMPAEELKVWPEFLDLVEGNNEKQDRETINRFTAEMDLSRKDHENQLQAVELQRNRLNSELKSRVIYVTLGFVLLLIGCLVFGILQMKKIRQLQQYVETNVLQRFLPPEIVKEIRAGRSRLDEDARIRPITVIFADLVEFTSSSERLGPAKSARVLNDFLMGMTEVIFAHGGTIDKFIGDAVMVIFGAPSDMENARQVSQALACARHMQEKLADLNEVWGRELGINFAMRTGISHGEAMVGVFGSSKRSDYTAIGTTVNLAARIEAQAMPNQILLSAAVAAYAADGSCSSRGCFKLKGIQDEQELFELRDTALPLAI